MTRVLALLMLAGCAGSPCTPAAMPAPAKAHDHQRASGASCAEQCMPWACSAAWDVDSQADAACDKEGDLLCVCQAP